MTLKGRRFSSSSEVIENATVELNKLRKIDFELAFQQLFFFTLEKCVAGHIPAVICHHVAVPDTLISLFHHFHALIESLALFITICTEIIREFFLVAMQVVNLNTHIYTQSFIAFKDILNKLFVIIVSSIT
ncbi:hypothetical protein LAZ67_12001883 [Cordylochernes scorpioides]|uniref:Uncharacterized protein n=1 Tax=Cordylochernes scorpioides TaxID=51811 RepID=A0ABY6L273_9ARAC|nr:hypothetical protein LAZ67_12001883 [Cordylochernes scorpioides]